MTKSDAQKRAAQALDLAEYEARNTLNADLANTFVNIASTWIALANSNPNYGEGR
jgi:hypothetical protein